MTGERQIIAAVRSATFGIGDVVKHRFYPFRGIIFDVDPEFANSEEWYQSIPEDVRPIREQPYYHLLADNGQEAYVAYVSQQNLLTDEEGGEPLHPAVAEMFDRDADGRYRLRPGRAH
ncbi:heat shock protein HspQ [Pacificimonas flava]|uniref:Heat shock protein HspQ n=1 Tax=Pacificimonas flava TaxID=1234595 RepID=M2T8S3_9SPHN|nr:heat shock protein HspQ [Pacificimonas flava]EMD82889.1 Hemimethylated DNA-binding region protein [Pacificimonas flava]MBB5279502.1 heat shock protein HspQ [Pacificimonas flava]